VISESLIKKILKSLLKSGGNFSEVYIQKKIANNIKLEDKKIENCSSGYESGCGLRLCFGDITFYAYVDSLQEEKLLNAAEILSSAANSSCSRNVLNLTASKSSYNINIDKYPGEILPEAKKNILLEVDKVSRDYSSNVIQVTSRLLDSEEEICIANCDGVYSFDKVVKTMLAVNVVAKKGKEVRTGYKSLARTCGYEIFNLKSPKAIAEKASRIAVTMLDAVNAPVGTFPVVIGPAFGGVIFHEACGHGLEADAILKDASVFNGKLGKKIANSTLTAVDDSTIPYHWGSYKFDGEGHHSSRTVLIKDGILRNYIYDLKTAKKSNKPQTGNGRRQSYKHIPIPRMSNTYIDNGKEKPESIIKSVNKGIYAKEFAGGQVDPVTGDFVFGVSEGYLIENGSISVPIKGATLIGNGPEVLVKVEAIGNDLDFAPGFCGKDGQSVSNEVGQPTIIVSGITVGGTKI